MVGCGGRVWWGVVVYGCVDINQGGVTVLEIYHPFDNLFDLNWFVV